MEETERPQFFYDRSPSQANAVDQIMKLSEELARRRQAESDLVLGGLKDAVKQLGPESTTGHSSEEPSLPEA